MKKISVTLMTLMGVLFASYHFAQAKDWRSYRSMSDFPAYVRSLSFPGGYKMHASHGLRWGKWDVFFGSSSPRARLNQCNSDACPNIYIQGLTCKNEVAGSRDCGIQLIHFPQFPNQPTYVANVLKPGTDKIETQIKIACPNDLELR